jgi:hypothetical protein
MAEKGIFYQPWFMDERMEQQVKTKVLGEAYLRPTLSIRGPTWIFRGLKPDLRSRNPAINCLSSGTACLYVPTGRSVPDHIACIGNM